MWNFNKIKWNNFYNILINKNKKDFFFFHLKNRKEKKINQIIINKNSFIYLKFYQKNFFSNNIEIGKIDFENVQKNINYHIPKLSLPKKSNILYIYILYYLL